MNAPALGIAYALWLRLRWMFAGLAASILLFAVVVRMFPDFNEFSLPTALMALIFQLVPVLSVFTYSPADLGAKGSGYPAHMMVLPVSTRWLAGWPILFGSGTFAAVWLLAVAFIFHAAGLHPPMIWPATVTAAGVAWVQALAWSPFPSPFARVPALIAAIVPLISMMLWAGLYLPSATVSIAVTCGGVVWWIAACGVAINGLSRARGGSQGNWFGYWNERRVARAGGGAVIRESFRSACAAQLWLEWRRNVIFLPAMVGFLALPLVVLLCVNILNPGGNEGLLVGSIMVSPAMIGLGILVFVPLLMSSTAGSNLGKFDMWGSERMSSFFATRPMTNEQYVEIKILAAAISALVTWCVVLLVFAIWAAIETSPWNPRESLVRGFFAQAGPREFGVVVLLMLGLLAILWRNLVGGMWPTMTGRKWFATGLSILSLFATLCLPGLAGWVYRQQLQATILQYAPWMMGAAIGLKICAAAAIAIVLVRLGLLSRRRIRFALTAWSLAAAGMLFAIGLFVEWTWYLPAGVVLMLPLARIGAAPLALTWNRHR